MFFLVSLSSGNTKDINLQLLNRFHPNSDIDKIFSACKKGYDEVVRQLLTNEIKPDTIFKEIAIESDIIFECAKKDPTHRSYYFGFGSGIILQISLNMYKATGEIRFLELFEKIFSQLILQNDIKTNRKDARIGRSLPGWSSDTPNGTRTMLMHTSRLAYCGLQFAEITSNLSGSKFLRERGIVFGEFAKQALFAFDFNFIQCSEDGKNYCFFKVCKPEKPKWHEQPHPFNHVTYLELPMQ